jgi:ABC-type dipeptide/oligopeptide/nickel transport system permease subunit
MNPTTSRALEVAARLHKSGNAADAGSIIAKYLKQDPRNSQAWYLLSLIHPDYEKQKFALNRAIQLDPEHQSAKDRLSSLTLPPTKTATPTAITSSPPDNPVTPTIQAVTASSSAAAAIPLPRIIPAPDLGVTRNWWQRVKIRSSLSWQRFKMGWAVFSQSPLAILGIILIVIFAIMAIAHPVLMKTVWPRGTYDPVTGFDMKVFPHPSPPSSSHLLGTDTLGRDVLSMLLAATTPTFLIGLTAALTTAIVGTTMSVLAAYFRGAVDIIITNLADVFLLFPAPVIMVIIGARFRDLGPIPLGLIYGMVTGAGGTVIIMRTHALQTMAKPFMEAAKISGGGPAHIISKHLLPAMLPLAALQMMVAVTGAVVADGFISFFGLTRITNNWGTLIYDAFVYGASIGHAGVGLWNMLLPAAICFSLFALAFYLVSRGLHRVASPTIREEY